MIFNIWFVGTQISDLKATVTDLKLFQEMYGYQSVDSRFASFSAFYFYFIKLLFDYILVSDVSFGKSKCPTFIMTSNEFLFAVNIFDILPIHQVFPEAHYWAD